MGDDDDDGEEGRDRDGWVGMHHTALTMKLMACSFTAWSSSAKDFFLDSWSPKFIVPIEGDSTGSTEVQEGGVI